MRRWHPRDDRGATLVEFALLVPVLVMLLFGLVEFGVAYDRQQALTGAAREGARAASIGRTVSQIESRVDAATGGTNFDGAISVSVSPNGDPPCSGSNSGATVTVDLAVNEMISIPFVSDRIVTLTAKGSFLCE